MANTVRYEIVSDEFLEEISNNADKAATQENFIDYASSVYAFHHYIASITIELQQYRSKYGSLGTNIVTKTVDSLDREHLLSDMIKLAGMLGSDKLLGEERRKAEEEYKRIARLWENASPE